MANEYTYVRDENTGTPTLGVLVFSGGFDYIFPDNISEESVADPDDLIGRYVATTGKSENDLEEEDYKVISLIPFNVQGLSIDPWIEGGTRSSVKKEITATLKEAVESIVTPSDLHLQQILNQGLQEMRMNGDVIDDVDNPEGAEEDIPTETFLEYLLRTIDPDGPDAWRIEPYLEDLDLDKELERDQEQDLDN